MSTGGMHTDKNWEFNRYETFWFLYGVFMLFLCVINVVLLIKLIIDILMLENWYLLSHLDILITNEDFLNSITLEVLSFWADPILLFMAGYLSYSKAFAEKRKRLCECKIKEVD